MDATMGKGKLIDEIFGAKCEGNYIQPTFITDYQRKCHHCVNNTETILN
jgi:lysyl-tRNA synthetase class 2